MKKFLLFILFLVFSNNLNADYKLILTNKDGVQNEQCIKSYSFSNNLESLANKNMAYKDVYSEEETATNKVYNGKTVYRKLVTIPKDLAETQTSKYVEYNNPPQNVEKLIYAREVGYTFAGASFYSNKSVWKANYIFYSHGMQYNMGKETVTSYRGRKVIIEYTKTTEDKVKDSANSFKSYLHYVPSASLNEEVISVNLENLGVQFLKDFTYDKETNSCIKDEIEN